jgi:hypothetical protein
MGVHEYFAYDPNTSPVAKAQRLFGWRLAPQSGRIRPLTLRSPGSLWSSELASFLVAAEQEARRAEIEARRAQALAEKLRTLGIDPDQISYSS